MPSWEARPIVNGRIAKNNVGTLRGRHRTQEGMVQFIKTNGRSGTTYAVAIKVDVGWLEAEPVTVPNNKR